MPSPHASLITALVTGSTSGIGRATAVALARMGMHVVVHGRDAERADLVAEEVRAAGGTATVILADLAQYDEVVRLAEEAEAATGGIDVLINNAAQVQQYGPSAGNTTDEIDRNLAVNVKAPYALVAAIGPKMAARGRGSIINVSMVAASKAVQGITLTSASKAALESLTRGWTADYGPSNVRVNTVSLGVVLTPANAQMMDQMTAFALSTPARRPASAEEVAEAITFLASPASSFIHGVNLPIDGGMSIT